MLTLYATGSAKRLLVGEWVFSCSGTAPLGMLSFDNLHVSIQKAN